METTIKFSAIFEKEEAERLIYASMNNDPYFGEVEVRRINSKDQHTFVSVEGSPGDVASAMFHAGQMFQAEYNQRKKDHERTYEPK